MKFTREKVSALTGDTEVRLTLAADNSPFPPFRLIADKQGIRLEGKTPVVEDMAGLQELAKAVSGIWKEHEKLKTKIVPV
jgi:hypothetical protein